MSSVYGRLDSFSSYRDNRSGQSIEEQHAQLNKSATLYIGNLSFYTTEQQIYQLFGRTGTIRRIIMGLDRHNKTPCGFCFVEYYNNADALNALKYISGTKLDERIIRADLDPGYKDGRQYGRGKSGGQVRDEFRQDYDSGRGGWGHAKVREEEQREERTRYQENLYQEDHVNGLRDVAGGGQRGEESNPRFRRERDDEDDEY